MTRANSAAIKLGGNLPGATFIGLLHARLEVAEAETDAIDRKRLMEGNAGFTNLYHMLALESRTMGEAILMQRPTCPEDAAILAHHISSAMDLIDSYGMDDEDEADKKARREVTAMVNRAVQLLFCYLVDAAPIEPESIGTVFALSIDHARKYENGSAYVEGE